MSTTQGPYGTYEHYVTHADGLVWSADTNAQAESLAEYLNMAHAEGYAEGQSSKQAELDKAVELLRVLATIPPRMTDGFYTDVILAARAYLSTLNPQPDAAQ